MSERSAQEASAGAALEIPKAPNAPSEAEVAGTQDVPRIPEAASEAGISFRRMEPCSDLQQAPEGKSAPWRR